MSEYKKQLIGYINSNRSGKPGNYLSIANVSDEIITIKPGEKLHLNQTPDHIKQKYPSTPDFSKSIKVEEQDNNFTADQIVSDIPF